MSSTSKSGDLTFKSSSEIKSFVRHQMEKPGLSGTGAYADSVQSSLFYSRNFDGAFRDPSGRDITTPPGFFQLTWLVMFRNLFNPVDYTGSLRQEIRKHWDTNELGFVIGVSFSLAVLWQLQTYRRNQLLLSKKRFVYQEYKRRKFLEDSLRMRSRSDIVNEK